MATLSHHYRIGQSARTVRSLIAVGVPLLVAVDVAADAFELRIGEVLAAWGAL